MQRGIITFFHNEKGFGFIQAETGERVFFHANQRHPDEHGQPIQDATIYYDTKNGPKGLAAVQWRLKPPVVESEIDPERDRREGYRPGVIIALRWGKSIFLGRRCGFWSTMADLMEDFTPSDPLQSVMTEETLIEALTAAPTLQEEERITAFVERQRLIPEWRFSWGVPQGGIEDGETCKAAIKRELTEELGDYTNREKYEKFMPNPLPLLHDLGWVDCIVGEPKFLFKDRATFKVEKDGRVYNGKTLYAFVVDISGMPETADAWMFGSRGDEDCSLPCPGFEGGGKFYSYEEAHNLVRATQKGAKGNQLVRLIEMAQAA